MLWLRNANTLHDMINERFWNLNRVIISSREGKITPGRYSPAICEPFEMENGAWMTLSKLASAGHRRMGGLLT